MKENNIAFIDGQNLRLWTSTEWWAVDYKKFRIYLNDKFHVTEAYYYLWYVSEEEQDLYKSLQKAWFIVSFREHSSNMMGKKKWNVDVDIVFEIMKSLIERSDYSKIALVSWDGDYIKAVKYLISKDKLKTLLFPNRQYSSLYRKLDAKYRINISLPDIRAKIEYTKKKGAS